jgi:hypothetical protein
MASNTGIAAVRAQHDFADLAIVGVTAVALAFSTLLLCVMPMANFAGSRDFVVYWAAGQQLVHHANPYDQTAIMRIERAAGLPAQNGTMYVRNPPWSLPLTLPLGLIGVKVATVLWSLALFACLLLSVRILWRLHGSRKDCIPWLGVSFGPALLCMLMGQTSLFALLGYVLFLDLHRRRPFIAGASLWLCTLKPHLFLPFAVVLAVWIAVSKSYRLLAGAAAAVAASSAVVFLLDRTAWLDYATMMRSAQIQNDRVPCLSVAMRFWISPRTFGLTYLPVALACIWALAYFWQRRHTWDWMKNGSLVMIVSLVTAPYSWVYDDGLAIPALLHGAYLTRSRVLLTVLAFGAVAIGAELLAGVKIATSFFLWTAPTWLVWYLCATGYWRIPASQAADQGTTLPESL